MNNILYVTLARGGSKGVPDKHTRILGGKPVLAWTINAVKGCAHEGDYVVSSDDPKIIAIAKKLKVETLLRPGDLAQDDTPTLPALQHAVRIMEDAHGKRYKYIVEVRATSPFKTREDIDDAVSILIDRHLDSVIGVVQLEDHHPMRAKWMDSDGYLHDFLNEPESGRRQDCTPKAYVRNGTIYALTREVVMEQGKLFGHKRSIGYVMPLERSVNIDTEIDWLVCKAMAESENKDAVGS